MGDKDNSRTNKHAILFYRLMLIGSGQTLNDQVSILINQHFTSQDDTQGFWGKSHYSQFANNLLHRDKVMLFCRPLHLRADSIAFLPLKPSCWSTSDIACISMLRAFYAFFLWLQWYFRCQLPCTKNIRNQLRGAKLALLCWQLERVRVSRKSKISW